MALCPLSSVLALVSNSFVLRIAIRLVEGVWISFVSALVAIQSLFAINAKLQVRPLPQIVHQVHGYPVETHEVTTTDGYRLTLFRIAGKAAKGKSPSEDCAARPAVLLMHGLMDCAYTWITLGPHDSLAYVLADNGFDVWLGNNRGTAYGRRHQFLDVNTEEFWRFSFDEMGVYDVPNIVDYIRNKTGHDKISYVGHSEGTTQMFVKLALDPAFSSKLSCFVGLGPVAKVGKVTNRFVRTVADLNLDRLGLALGFRKGFFPTQKGMSRKILATFLYRFPWIADDVVRLICGSPRHKFKSVEAGLWMENEPGGTSMQNMSHWIQAFRSGKFQLYDYGSAENVVRYKTASPPELNISRVPSSLPKLMMYGSEDDLVDPADLQDLVDALGSTAQMQRLDGFDHLDYMWDKSASTVVFPQLLQFLQKHCLDSSGDPSDDGFQSVQ